MVRRFRAQSSGFEVQGLGCRVCSIWFSSLTLLAYRFEALLYVGLVCC